MPADAADPWQELVCTACESTVRVARHPRGRLVLACPCSTRFVDRENPAELSVDALPSTYPWELVESSVFTPEDPL